MQWKTFWMKKPPKKNKMKGKELGLTDRTVEQIDKYQILYKKVRTWATWI
jgi:hypothetical protein